MTGDNSASTETRKHDRAHTWAQIVYSLRVLVLLVALGVVIWVYNGDAYVTGVLLICALGVFAAGIAPGLVPELVRWVAMMPFVLGALIPLWRLVDALFRWEQDPILRALGVLVAYAIAAVLLIRLPVRMREPFVRWLPKGAIPSEEAEAIRRRVKEREDAARKAERERAEREKQAARAKAGKAKQAAESESGGKKRFGFGRGKKAAEDETPPKKAASKPAASGGKTNPFYTPSGSSAPDPEPESGGKKRFGFGRGKKAAEDEASPKKAASKPAASGGKTNPFYTPSGSSAPNPEPESGGKKRFGFGRGKKAAEEDAPPKKAASKPAASSSKASPFYDSYGGDEDEEEAIFSGGGRYDADSRYDPPGMGRRASPFYGQDDEDDDEDDAAGGYNWSRTSDPDRSPEDDLLDKIREKRKNKPKW